MKRVLVVIFLGLCFPLISSAQNFQFGIGVNFSVLSYNEEGIDESRVFWGGHGRFRIYKYFAAELSLQQREDSFRIGQGTLNLRTRPLQLSGIVYPLAMYAVSPYFLAGTGWYDLKADISGDLGLPFVTGEGRIETTETAYHIGIGVEAFIGKHFSFGADARKIFLEFDTFLIRYKLEAYVVNIAGTFYF